MLLGSESINDQRLRERESTQMIDEALQIFLISFNTCPSRKEAIEKPRLGPVLARPH